MIIHLNSIYRCVRTIQNSEGPGPSTATKGRPSNLFFTNETGKNLGIAKYVYNELSEDPLICCTPQIVNNDTELNNTLSVSLLSLCLFRARMDTFHTNILVILDEIINIRKAFFHISPKN